MAKAQYGTTWWGQRWLAALSDIDEENRIPRGKSYANTGKVKSFIINEKKRLIEARVIGHYDPFYKVKIILPPIEESKIQRLIEEIVKSPLLTGKLSAHELDPSLLSLCEKLGVSLFPKRWSDFDMHCSCPDWAVPCKHIAAVIYKISQEIDTNPFILFKLRGVDLVKELESRGVAIKKATQAKLPTWRDLVGIPKKGNKENKPILGMAPTEEPVELTYELSTQWLERLNELTFTPIEFERESTINLLKETPAGYVNGSLREELEHVIETAGKMARAQMNDEKEHGVPERVGENEWITINTWGQVRCNEGFQWTEHGDEEGDFIDCHVDQERPNGAGRVFLHQMFSGYLNPRRLSSAPETVEALYYAWVIASKFVEAGAVKPQLYEPEEDIFTTRWVPIASCEAMEEFLEKLGRDLLQLRAPYFEILSRPRDLAPRTMADIVLGMFISSYIAAAFLKGAGQTATVEEVTLFLGQTMDCEGNPRFETVKSALSEWLTPLVPQTQEEIIPVLTVHDRHGQEAKAKTALEAFARPIGVELGFNIPHRGRETTRYVTLADVLENPKLTKWRFTALRCAARLSNYCPELVEILRAGKSSESITMQELSALMFKAIPAMRLLGVQVILPRSLSRLLTPELSLAIDMEKEWNLSSGFFGLADLLEFDWRIAAGDVQITPAEFKQLCQQAGQIVYFHNQYIYVDEKQILAIQKKMAGKNLVLNPASLIRAALSGSYNEANVSLSGAVKKALDELFKEKKVAVPKTIQAKLRPYQKRGFEWLLRNARIGLGSILADDMGLGKTLQVLTTLEAMRQAKEFDEHQALIIVPTSLVENWLREAARFTPKLVLQPFYGTERRLDVKGAHAILTTYGVFRTSVEQFKKRRFRMMVLDEAQAVKNHATATFKAVRSVKCDTRIAMSGTPVENRLLEYWSIMEATNPGLLGSSSNFKREFSVPIEVHHDLRVANRFKKMTAPFIMRRLKTDKTIISDLPDKISTNEFCTLTPEQAALYKATVQTMMERLATSSTDNFTRRAIVLQLMLQLKQICNAPLQYQEKSEFDRPENSGKMQRLFELLDMMQEANRKVLVFTQFKEMGLLLQKWISERYKRKLEFIHGGLSVKERQRIVDAFQTRREEKVLILSLKAAGTGLNLTAASAIVHYDLWWNPAVEAQATDRAYRIGQKRNVNVYRLICSHSFEEKIDAMMRAKQALSELTVATGESWIGDLSNKELEDLFSLSNETKQSKEL